MNRASFFAIIGTFKQDIWNSIKKRIWPELMLTPVRGVLKGAVARRSMSEANARAKRACGERKHLFKGPEIDEQTPETPSEALMVHYHPRNLRLNGKNRTFSIFSSQILVFKKCILGRNID